MIIVLFSGLGCESNERQGISQAAEEYYTPSIRSYLTNVRLPSSRQFHMGFTSQPYDFKEKAYEYTYEKVAEHGDFLAFHLDSGVPWPEAVDGKDRYHPNLLRIVNDQVARYLPGQIRYVSTSPQAQDRLSLAPYWGIDDGLDLPQHWKNKTFDDPEVIKAYLNWCRFVLRTYKPDYFNYGIEVNYSFTGVNDKRFRAYLTLLRTVYPKLKSEFPDVRILLEFVDVNIEAGKERVLQIAKEMVSYTDIIGISTYPYFLYSDPSEIPDTWLREMAELDPTKPIAITETGYIAEPMNLPSLHLYSDGSPDKQMRYTQKLLRTLSELNTEFLIWWEIRDIDQTIEIFSEAGHGIAAKLWKDIGFYDGNGRRRPALDVWEQWFKLPRN